MFEEQKVTEQLLGKQARLQSEIEWQRSNIGGNNKFLELSVRAQRRVILLENRLGHAFTSKSVAETTAKNLKEQVNGLRREKRLYEELRLSTERLISTKAHEIAAILKKIFEIYDQRNKAEAMCAQIQVQAAKDAQDAEKEYERLTQVISYKY